MFNFVIFGVYLVVLIFLFGFIAIFVRHIRDFQEYSRYLRPIMRTYIVLMMLIALFGGYMILTGQSAQIPQSTAVHRLNF